MKYRKKPIVVEAIQWTGDNIREIKALDGERFSRVQFDNGHVFIESLEGHMVANLMDYIIKGVKGELYPCKPDIFKETYEKV
jgi:hypothetical protein